jgi:two-component system LytT family response regulator
LTPDLVFLDVQMPKVGGFEVIEITGAEKMPAVISVTAYDEFVLRAFDVNAIDYFLKPFDEVRLAKAIARVKREIKREVPPTDIEEKLRKLLKEVQTKPEYLRRIPVKSARGTTVVLTEEIDWILPPSIISSCTREAKLILSAKSCRSLRRALIPNFLYGFTARPLSI